MTQSPQLSHYLREPGLYLSRLGHERHIVPGGGALALALHPGDRIEVIDPQGLQVAQVAGFNERGQSCVGRLGLSENTNSELLCLSLAQAGAAGKALLTKLERFDIALPDAKLHTLLDGHGVADSRAEFTCQEAVLGMIAAPGLPMAVNGPYPSTDLVVHIWRANTAQSALSQDLPDPLADPLQDIRVKDSSARAYEVKKGQYIQIIDVAGRQCSDLQCFDIAKLDRGIERCLDATTTRTLMGNAYPGPGLYSKFYDVDFEPVLEVVQDTCGRHDSFGLACSAKYYDDAGYPRHVNCSDNFNHVLSSYGIAPRRGWMAMNLFFNTFFDDTHQLLIDEPWSRAGDYVLLRALKDMVCVTSACPDDIDVANGWTPTDIHVRTYEHNELFKRAIAFRKTPEAEPTMTQETGFHSETSKLTRDFTEYNGYWLANSFVNHGAVDEYWACRERVIVTDLSPLRKYEVLGPDAERLMQHCVTRNVRKLAVGQVAYTAMCYESGGMIDDGTVFRMCENNFRWVGGCDSSGLWLRQQASALGLRAWVKDATSQLNNLQVQGPKSRDTLRDIIWTRPDQASIDELGVFRFSVARLHHADGIPILVSRTGYTGELGYEIFCHPQDAAEVWQAVWQAGQAYKIAPLGLAALDMLRIEAGLIFAGYEFCDQTDPFEAGIGFTVPLKSKEDDFIGRAALTERKAHPQTKMVGLILEGEEIAGHDDGVYIGREQVGTVTSGTYSPYLRKNIALCKMKTTHSEIGTEVEVGKLDGHQKRIAASVSRMPHFDPTKERVKGNYD